MKKVNVLFVAYQFPPLMVAGSYRPFRFVKYFSENSSIINPVVARLSPKSYGKVYEKPNVGSEGENLKVKIYDIESEELINKGKLRSFIDIYFNLYKGSEARGIEKSFRKLLFEIIEEEKIDLVWVTCPPFSIGDMVRRLLKKSDIPFIVDFRDAWALWLSQPYGTRIHYHFTKKAERKLLKAAAAVVVTTNQQITDFVRNQKVSEDKFHFIPNSFSQDLSELNDLKFEKKSKSLTIGYVGSFYFNPETHKLQRTKWYKREKHRKLYYWPRQEEWIYRSPYFFFKAVRGLLDVNEEYEIKIKFAGTVPEWLPEMVQSFGLEKIVEYSGYISGDELTDFYKSCDVLLLTSIKVKDAEDYFVASKSFDYLRAQKPVLAFVKEGSQKQFLENSQNAHIVDADDVEKGVNKLTELANSEELNVRYNKSFLKNYSVAQTSLKLEKVIASVVK